MQAKDIPDDVFLAVVAKVNAADRWAFIWDLNEAFPGVPEKLLRAKADKLIRRGLLDGCACGCRGDFEVVA